MIHELKEALQGLITAGRLAKSEEPFCIQLDDQLSLEFSDAEDGGISIIAKDRGFLTVHYGQGQLEVLVYSDSADKVTGLRVPDEELRLPARLDEWVDAASMKVLGISWNGEVAMLFSAFLHYQHGCWEALAEEASTGYDRLLAGAMLLTEALCVGIDEFVEFDEFENGVFAYEYLEQTPQRTDLAAFILDRLDAKDWRNLAEHFLIPSPALLRQWLVGYNQTLKGADVWPVK